MMYNNMDPEINSGRLMKKLSSPIDHIKEALNIFFDKNNIALFIKVYAVLIPFGIWTFFQNNFLNNYLKNTTSISSILIDKSFGLVWLFIIVGLIYLVVSFLVSAAGLFAVIKVVFNIKTSVKDVYTEAWKRLFPYSLLLILQGLIVGLGLLLLIVPGIIAMVWFSFAAFQFVLKGTGIAESLSGSRNLVKGRFWPVLGRILVFGAFAFIVQIITSIVPYGLGSIIAPFFGALLTLPYVLLYRELSV